MLLLLLVGVVVVAVIAFLARAGSSSVSPNYVAAPVVRGTLDIRVNAVGTLQPTNVVTVGSEVSGTVAAVRADVNDHVVRGQVLASVDSSRFRDAVDRSRAALAVATAAVAQSLASERQARSTLARQRRVAKLSGGLTPSDIELDAARGDLERATATTASARAGVVQAKAQLSADLTNLERATIVAPVDGVVLTRSIEPGQTLAAAFATPSLFLVARDLHMMRLQIRIDEADVGLVRPGAAATFRVDAFPGRTFLAKVARVNVAANGFGAPEGAGRSGEGAIVYTALLDVQNQDLSLKPGMTATARVEVRRLRDALLVPDAALRFRPKPPEKSQLALNVGPSADEHRKAVAIGRGRRQSVYLLKAGGSLAAVPVTVIASDGTSSAIADAVLRPGARVATGVRGTGR